MKWLTSSHNSRSNVVNSSLTFDSKASVLIHHSRLSESTISIRAIFHSVLMIIIITIVLSIRFYVPKVYVNTGIDLSEICFT